MAKREYPPSPPLPKGGKQDPPSKGGASLSKGSDTSPPLSKGGPGGVARHAYEGLDRILHEKARLGIMTSLMTRPEGLLFGDLKQLCALTDGNLSRHLDVLHDAGLLEIWKGIENRRPHTLCRLTTQGRQRFLEYLGELERVIRDALPQRQPAASVANLTSGLAPA